jgi:hypothetical protein
MGLTRREVLLQGSLALAWSSPLVRRLAETRRTCMLGAFSREPLNELESLIDHRLRIDSRFVAWEEPFPFQAGRAPLLAWDGRRDVATISAGRFDSLLRRRARDCRDFGAPVYLRWAAEFNGSWNPCFGQPGEFVSAWRHMVRTFRSAGATNVRFVWCPFAAPGWRKYYPGDRFVDWVGMDGYNWGTTRSWSRWQSFGEIFGPLYADYAGRKPLMICEVASAERGGDKAAWIRNMGRELAAGFSKVRALAWFHANKETDWRVNSSASALAAFRSVIADSRYS